MTGDFNVNMYYLIIAMFNEVSHQTYKSDSEKMFFADFIEHLG